MDAPPRDAPDSARGRILEAALEVLDRKGPAHLGIRGIARNAKVSVGLVHHYFTSKDGLLEACLDRLYGALFSAEREARTGLEEADDLAAYLAESARRGYRIAVHHRALVRVVKRIVAERGGLPSPIRTRVLGGFLTRWAGVIAERTGRPLWEVRTHLHSIVSLIGRYAVASGAELSVILGEPDLDEDALRDRVETHLAALAASIVPERASSR